MQRGDIQHVHFVDVVPEIMAQLKQRMSETNGEDQAEVPRPDGQWSVHCADLRTLVFPELPVLPGQAGRRLIVIAGVGGDLMIEMVAALQNNNPGQRLEFLLCPVYHVFKLRSALAESGFGLLNETIVQDGGLFYEILHIATDSSEPLSSVGSMMWDFDQHHHHEYLSQLISHYERVAKGLGQQKVPMLAEYRALLPQG